MTATADRIRLSGKGTYQGRTYYVGLPACEGRRVCLFTLPDATGAYRSLWVDTALVVMVKQYRPREVWDGRYCSGRTVTRYTTLGGIAKYIAEQRRKEATGVPACAVCGRRGELVEDLEDGLRKCRGCADLPAE